MIGSYIFPINFVIIDVDEALGLPLILGWSFLPTSSVLIDVSGLRMVLRVGDEEVVFRLPKVMRHS